MAFLFLTNNFMNISLLVMGAPYDSQSAYTAYRYAKAALESNHELARIFFYQSGVHNGTNLATPPQDEFNLYKAWSQLQQDYDLDLVVCIAAAARRGVIDEGEMSRHQKEAYNLAPGFELSGLGQLVEAMATSDRFITFGR
jgi:tRNA 2-thiouridine synthesizing protein D